MKVKRRLISVVVLFFIVFFAWIVFNTTNRKPIIYGNFGVNIPSTFPVLGMDVSHHQGGIIWPSAGAMKIDGDSLQFVYIKATEGISWIDDRLQDNTDGARQENIKYGFYHFYLPSLSVGQQAEHFCKNIASLGGDLCPAIDVEVTGDLTDKQLNDSLTLFHRLVESKTGKTPIIYTYHNFYKSHLTNQPINAAYYWIGDYGPDCALMNKDNFLIWQFTASGTVNGIRESVDLNIAKDSFFEICDKKLE